MRRLRSLILIALVAVLSACGADRTSGPTRAPSVVLTATPDQLSAAGNITLKASVTAHGGQVERVEFYQRIGGDSSTIVAQMAAPPYETTIAIPSADEHDARYFVAKAYDEAGRMDSSRTVSVAVDVKAPHVPPTLTLPDGWSLVGDVLDIDAWPYLNEAVTTDANGASYIAGKTRTNDVFLAKYDGSGTLAWLRTFGGPDWESSSSVSVDPSGRIYLVGEHAQTNQPARPPDCFVVLYDPSGSMIRTQLLPAAEVGNARCRGATDQSGNLYVGGASGYDATGGRSPVLDIVLTKYDRDGKAIWTRTLGSAPAPANAYPLCETCASPDNDDILGSIVADPAGGVLVSGSTGGSMDGAPPRGGGRDAFVVKFDADGNRHWSGQYGVPGYVIQGAGTGSLAAPDWNGGAYVEGVINAGGSTRLVAIIMRFGASGTLEWVKTFDSGGIAVGTAVGADRDDVYLVGSVSGGDTSHDFTEPRPKGSSHFLAKLSPGGALLEMSLLDVVGIQSVALLPGGDVVAVGPVIPLGSGVAVVRHHETSP